MFDPFKIQGIFKLEFCQNFITWNPWGIWSSANGERCSVDSNLASYKVWTFLKLGKAFDFVYKVWKRFEILEKVLNEDWAWPSDTVNIDLKYRPHWRLQIGHPSHDRATHHHSVATGPPTGRHPTCAATLSCRAWPAGVFLSHLASPHARSHPLDPASASHVSIAIYPPLPGTIVPSHCRPSRWITPPSSPEGVATLSSSSWHPPTLEHPQNRPPLPPRVARRC
jgi:hypothetical protein